MFHGQRNLEWLYLKNSPLSILLRSMPGHLLYTVAAAGYFTRLGLLGAFLRGKLAAMCAAGMVDTEMMRKIALECFRATSETH